MATYAKVHRHELCADNMCAVIGSIRLVADLHGSKTDAINGLVARRSLQVESHGSQTDSGLALGGGRASFGNLHSAGVSRKLFSADGKSVRASAGKAQWTRVVGLETAFRLVASTTEPMAMVGDVPADSAVEVIVQAVNGSRQGVASEPIIYRALSKAAPQMPAEAPSAATPLELVTVSSNANGSNGHGKGSRVPARN